jgi:DNA topoisomerase III
MSRRCFEEVLGAMARAGLLHLSDAVFEKDGTQIPYRSVKLTRAGQRVTESTPINFIMKELEPASSRPARKGEANGSSKQNNIPASDGFGKSIAGANIERTKDAETIRIEEALRVWRRSEAKRRAVPAFCIFNDRVLETIAANKPGTAGELLAIPGVGLRMIEKYGAEIYRILQHGDI